MSTVCRWNAPPRANAQLSVLLNCLYTLLMCIFRLLISQLYLLLFCTLYIVIIPADRVRSWLTNGKSKSSKFILLPLFYECDNQTADANAPGCHWLLARKNLRTTATRDINERTSSTSICERNDIGRAPLRSPFVIRRYILGKRDWFTESPLKRVDSPLTGATAAEKARSNNLNLRSRDR